MSLREYKKKMPVEIKKGLVEIPIEYYGVAKENTGKFLRDFVGLRVGGTMPDFTEEQIKEIQDIQQILNEADKLSWYQRFYRLCKNKSK